ncbi:MAG: sulfotransferase domain-containing protein [Cyanobacteriota bacterium]|nr:sulfotransferase domain-containing protein [Cyanobacteriota bacterium]
MEAKELSLIPRMNCIPRSFDADAPVNFFTAPFVTKNGMDNILNHFSNRDSDIYIATYPKSGTTWTISIIEYLINKVPQKGISTGASTLEACLWLDTIASGENWSSIFSELDKLKSPRFFKSHASVGLIKQPARIIQCIRHPLDTFVSAWHHIRGKKHLFYYNGSWSHFFLEIVLQSKYEGGDWFDYHEEFFQASQAGKIDALFLRYEDMKQDNAISAIHKLAEFINVKSYDAEEISRATDFKSMKQKSIAEGHLDTEGNLSDVLVSQEVGDKNNPSKAHIRKGMVGDWVNYLSEDELNMWRNYVNTKKDYCPHVVDLFSLDNLLCK